MKTSHILIALTVCTCLLSGCSQKSAEITKVSFGDYVTILSNTDADATEYDDGLVNFCTIVKVSDSMYYLYYTSMGKEGPVGDFDQKMCFAWSTDGFHYHRSIPEGVNAPYPGTNVLSMSGIIEMDVCLVEDEEFPFRMVACIKDPTNRATLYKSADGVNFSMVSKLTKGGNDTQNAIVTRGDSLKVFVRGHFNKDRRAVSLLTCDLNGNVLTPQSNLINLPVDELYQPAASDLDGKREILFPTFYDRTTSYQELRCYIVDGREFRRIELDTGNILSEEDKSIYAAPGLVEIGGEKYILYQTRDSDHEHFDQKTTVSRLKMAKVYFHHDCSTKPAGTSQTENYDFFGAHISCIWDTGYSAFPSIVSFNGKYYVSFREGKSHIFDENGIAAGAARILKSDDGVKWEPVALLTKDGYDLRDPKLSVTPDGRLMVIMGGSVYEDKVLVRWIPQVAFSSDGDTFTAPEPVVLDSHFTEDRSWIWRVTWQDGVGYGVTYGEHFALLKTADGLHYDYVTELCPDTEGEPGESTIRFTKDGKMLMMIRCEGKDGTGRWGVSGYPYTDWEWSQIKMHLGGPDFIVTDDGTVIAGTRYTFTTRTNKTLVMRGDVNGHFEEMLLVPSNGDTSYPGFIEVGDEVWMVYYSCHGSVNGSLSKTSYDYNPAQAQKSRAAIYLARFPKKMLQLNPTAE